MVLQSENTLITLANVIDCNSCLKENHISIPSFKNNVNCRLFLFGPLFVRKRLLDFPNSNRLIFWYVGFFLWYFKTFYVLLYKIIIMSASMRSLVMVIHTEKLNVMLRLNTSYRNKFFVSAVKIKVFATIFFIIILILLTFVIKIYIIYRICNVS